MPSEHLLSQNVLRRNHVLPWVNPVVHPAHVQDIEAEISASSKRLKYQKYKGEK